MSSIPISNLEGDQMLERLQKATGESRYPLQCQWEITCRCNLKCVMCYTDCFNTPEWIRQELSLSEIIRIMDEMKEAGVLELVLTGGEPMSRTDFEEIYCHAVRSGFLTTVFTNGTLIDEKWIKVWKEFPPHMIEISYHGAGASTFDQVTAMKGSYERVRAGIQRVVESNLPLTLKTTGITMNHNEIFEIKKFVRSFENVLFRFGSEIRTLANGDESSLHYQLSEEVLGELMQEDPELKNDFDRKQMKDKSNPYRCHEGRRRFHIDAYGNLQLCSNNRRKGYSLRTGSFKEGFYEHLPQFPCPNKKSENELLQLQPYGDSNA